MFFQMKVPVCTSEIARDRNCNIGVKDAQNCLMPTIMQTGDENTGSFLRQNESEEASLHSLKRQSCTTGTGNGFVRSPNTIGKEITLQMEGSRSGQVCLDRQKEEAFEVTLPAVTADVLESDNCNDMKDISSNVTTIDDHAMCDKDVVSTDSNPQMEELSKVVVSSGSSKYAKESLVVKEGYKKSFADALVDKMRKVEKTVLLEQVTSNEGEGNNAESNGTRHNSVLCEGKEPLNGKEKNAKCQSALKGANASEVVSEKCQSVITGINTEENGCFTETTKEICGEDLLGEDIVRPENNKMKELSTQNNADLRLEGNKVPEVHSEPISCDLGINKEIKYNMEDAEGAANDKSSCRVEGKSDSRVVMTELVKDVSDSNPGETGSNYVTNVQVDKNGGGKNDRGDDFAKEKYDNIFDRIRIESEIVREQEAMEIAASLFFEHTEEEEEDDDNPQSNCGMKAQDSDERNKESAKWVDEDQCNNSVDSGSDMDINSCKESDNKIASSALSSKLTAAQRLIEKFKLNIGKNVSEASSDTKKQKRGRKMPANRGYDENTDGKSQNSGIEILLESKRAKLTTDGIEKGSHETTQKKKTAGKGAKTLAPKALLRLPPQLMDIGNSAKAGRKNKNIGSAGRNRETVLSKEKISISKRGVAGEVPSSSVTKSSHSFTAIRQPLDKTVSVDTQSAKGRLRLDNPIVGVKGIGTEIKENKTSRKKHQEPLQSSDDASKKVTTFKVCVKIMCAEKASYVKQTDRGPVNVIDKSVQIITVKKRVSPENRMEKCAAPSLNDKSATAVNHGPAEQGTNRDNGGSKITENRIPQVKQLVRMRETAKDKKQSIRQQGETGTKNESTGVEIIDAPGKSKDTSPSNDALHKIASNMEKGDIAKVTDTHVVSRVTAEKTSTGTSTTIDLTTAGSGGVSSGNKQGIIDLTIQSPEFQTLSSHHTSTATDATKVSQINGGLPQVISAQGSTDGSVVTTLSSLSSSSDVIQVPLASSTTSRTTKSNIFPKIVGFCSLAQLQSTERIKISRSKEVELHVQKENNQTTGIGPISTAEGLKIAETLSHAPSHTENSNEFRLTKNCSAYKKSDTTANSLGTSCSLGSHNIQSSVIVSGAEQIWPTAPMAASGQMPCTTGHDTLPAIVSSSIVSKSNQKNIPSSLGSERNICLQQDSTMPTPQPSSVSSRNDVYVSSQQPIRVPTQQEIPVSWQQGIPVSMLQGIPVPVQPEAPVSNQQGIHVSIQQATSVSLQQAAPISMEQGIKTIMQQGTHPSVQQWNPVSMQQDSSLCQEPYQMLQESTVTKQQGNPMPRLQLPTLSLPTPDLAPIHQSVESSSYQRIILVQDHEGKYALVPIVVHMNRNMPNTAQSIQEDPISQSSGSQLPPQLNVLPGLPSSLPSNHPSIPLAPKSVMPALESTQSKLRASAANSGVPLLAPINMPKLTRAHSPAFIDNVLKIKTLNGMPVSTHPTSCGNLDQNTQFGNLQGFNLTNSSAINKCILAMNEKIGKVGGVNCLASSLNSNTVNTKSTTTGGIASNTLLRQIAPKVADVNSSEKTPGHHASTPKEKLSGTTAKTSGRSAVPSTQKQPSPGSYQKATTATTGNSTLKSNNGGLSTAKNVLSKEVYDTSPFWLKQASKVRLLDQSRCKLESSVFGNLSKRLTDYRRHITGQENDRCHTGSNLRFVKQIMKKYSSSNKREFKMKFGVFENQFVVVNENRPKHSFLPDFHDLQFIQNVGLECVIEALHDFEKALEDFLHSRERDQWKFGDLEEVTQSRKMRISMKRKLEEATKGDSTLQDGKKLKLMESEEEKIAPKDESVSLGNDSEMSSSGDIGKGKEKTIVIDDQVEKEVQESSDHLEVVMKVESGEAAEENDNKMPPANANVETKCINSESQLETRGSVKLQLHDMKKSDHELIVNRELLLKKTRTRFNTKRPVLEKKKGVGHGTKKTRSINGFKVRELFVGVEDILL